MQDELKHHVTAAAGREEVRAAVLELYADVQRQIDARRPVCVVSGRCCRFEEYGHRLYVTTLELATFLHQWTAMREAAPPDLVPSRPATGPTRRSLPVATAAAPSIAAELAEGCPFQVDKLCSVHGFRPFGCRMFFCDATSTEWQNEQYERFHARLKVLHATLAVSYFYVEWRTALRQILPNQPLVASPSPVS